MEPDIKAIETTASAKPAMPVSSSKSRAKLALHRRLVVSYSVVGLVIGYISFLINVPLYSLVLAIIVGIIATIALKKIFKPVDVGGKRWWSSGAAVYAFTWLIVWTILFNIYIVKP